MKRRALLIGVDGYHILSSLKYARRDAEGMADVLRERCGFENHQITLMTCQGEGGTHALSRFVESALLGLADDGELDLMVFGFWGHGFASKSGRRYLCGVDTTEDDLERSAVSLDIVKAKLMQVRAENTLIMLDCCQNQPVGRSTGAPTLGAGEEAAFSTLARDIQAARVDSNSTKIPTVALLNACREGQKAYEWDARQHGIFTAHLLDGLRGGETSIARLAHHLFDNVVHTAHDLHHQAQTPYFTIEGRGDIVLADPDVAIRTNLRPPASQETKREPPPIQHQWWVVIDGNERGPMPQDELENLIQSEKVVRASQVWKVGSPEWTAAKNIEIFAPLFPSLPPPRPEVNDKAGVAAKLRHEIELDIQEYARARLFKGSKLFLEMVGSSRLADWQKASDLDWPEGSFLVGRCLQEGLGMDKDQIAGVRMIRKAAELGFAMAQFALGVCYENGEGVSRDAYEAVSWYRKSAEQKDPSAQQRLGFCYVDGRGVVKNDGEAFRWFRKAAEQGCAVARYNVGECLSNGTGVKKNAKEAIKWFELAADQGMKKANQRLKEIRSSQKKQTSLEKNPRKRKPRSRKKPIKYLCTKLTVVTRLFFVCSILAIILVWFFLCEHPLNKTSGGSVAHMLSFNPGRNWSIVITIVLSIISIRFLQNYTDPSRSLQRMRDIDRVGRKMAVRSNAFAFADSKFGTLQKDYVDAKNILTKRLLEMNFELDESGERTDLVVHRVQSGNYKVDNIKYVELKIDIMFGGKLVGKETVTVVPEED